ncbi:MAG: hypothetical protein ABIK28_18120, partial [Planctomycetota bacterium]
MINLRSISYLLFFFSGFAALVYEVVWSRQFSVIFGSTIESVGVVLGAYMLGLALGGLILGRSADLLRNGFLLFAVLEALVGLYGCFSSSLFTILEQFCYSGGTPTLAFKAVLAGLYMIIPCFLIGGTLPVLSRFCLEEAKGNFSLTAGGLYAVNTLGAASGAYCCGFWFLENFGIQISLILAGGINLSVAITGLMLFFYVQHRNRLSGGVQEEACKTDDPQAADSPGRVPKLTRISLLFVFFLAGASTMGHEVVWTRILSQYLRNSVYSFACVLMAVLLGLAAGGGAGSWLSTKIRNRRYGLGLVQLLICIASLAVVLLVLQPFNELSSYRDFLIRWGGLDSFTRLAMLEAAFALSVVFIPAFLMGVSFPLMAGMTWRPAGRFGGFMGDLQFVITLGSVTGALGMAFYLIPSEEGRVLECVLCAAGANLLAALVLFAGVVKRIGWIRITGVVILLALGGGVYSMLPPALRFWKDHPLADEKLEFYTSDRIAEVAVVSNQQGRVLKVNNTSGLGGTRGEFIETRLGLFPV